MERRIELDEKKVIEIQQTNLQLMAKADGAIDALERATDQKDFGPLAESLLAEVEFHGKELARALKWWEDDFIGPVVNASYDLWKMLVSRRKVIGDPLDAKKKRAALAVGSYRHAYTQDRLRREDEERRRREKIEEDKKIAEALRLEKEGKKAEASEVIAEPIYTPPVNFAEPEKTKGVGQRGSWLYEVIEPELVPDEFWTIDTVKLASQVRINKHQKEIPGVRIYFQPSASFSSK